MPSENFMATGDCFKCNMYYVTAIGWLKKEDEERQR